MVIGIYRGSQRKEKRPLQPIYISDTNGRYIRRYIYFQSTEKIHKPFQMVLSSNGVANVRLSGLSLRL